MGNCLNWASRSPSPRYQSIWCPRSAIADLENLRLQSYGRNCGNRFLRGSDDCVSTTVCISCSQVRTATAIVVCGDPQSDGRVAGAPNHRSLPWDSAPKYLI